MNLPAENGRRKGTCLHVVVDRPALLDGAHDGGEVVVREHHVRRILDTKRVIHQRKQKCEDMRFEDMNGGNGAH